MMRAVAFLGMTAVSMVQSDASEITYRLTVRDFLPSPCLRPSVMSQVMGDTHGGLPERFFDGTPLGNRVLTSGDSEIRTSGERWTGSNYNNNKADIHWKDYCPYFDSIRAGEISGHPDFESGGSGVSSVRMTAGQGFCGCLIAGSKATNAEEYQCKDERGTDKTLQTSPGSQCEDAMVEFLGDYSHSSGLLKPIYWQENGKDIYGRSGGSEYFESWYNDNATFNKRVGTTIKLVEDVNQPGVFEFSRDGGKERGPGAQFFPLDEYIESVTQTSYVNHADAPVWPSSLVSETGNTFWHYDEDDFPDAVGMPKFWFTLELHTFFQYAGTETFTFNGDDDVFLFINGKRAIDLSGIHSALFQKIDLAEHATELGLEVDGIYELDMFVAERQYSESNVGISTTLTDVCNVLKSGSPADVSSWQFGPYSSIISATTSQSSFNLIDSSADPLSSTHAFLSQATNVGPGFVATWTFDASHIGQHEGFAFVLHNAQAGLVNMPSTTGSSLNADLMENAIVVAFDLCLDRIESGASACKQQEVALYYKGEDERAPGERNLTRIDLEDRKQNDKIMRTLKLEGDTHDVRIEYLAKPPVLDVYIGNSLYLRARNMDITKILGDSRSAFVGFTSATSSDTAGIKIENFQLETVSLNSEKTDLFEVDKNETELPTKVILADGEESAAFLVQSRDLCEDPQDSGGFAQFMTAKYVEALAVNATTYYNGSLTPQVIDAVVVDNEDGTYGAQLSTLLPATFDLHVCFGDGCQISVNLVDDQDTQSVPGLQLPEVSFIQGTTTFAKGSRFAAVEALALTASPTSSPIESPDLPPQVSTEAVQIGALAGGISAGLFLFSLSVAIFMRRKWNRDRAFIEKGKLHNLEQNITYDKSDEFSMVGAQLLDTRAAVLKERAQNYKGTNDGQVAAELQAENEDLKEQIRANKVKNQIAQSEVRTAQISQLAPKKKNRFSSMFSGS